MVRGPGYARAKLFTGMVFGALGAVIVYRTLTVAGPGLHSLPGVILGLAMLGLAVVRVRSYAAARRT